MALPDDTLPPLRRAEDPRIQQLVNDVAETKDAQTAMQRSIDQNTALTAEMKGTVDQVKDILTSMRVLGTAAKWVSSIVAAVGSAWLAIRQIKG